MEKDKYVLNVWKVFMRRVFVVLTFDVFVWREDFAWEGNLVLA